jgi:D-alanine-D-alanine ligase
MQRSSVQETTTMLSRKQKIGVLLGGVSSEREVSLRSGEAVIAALRGRGHDVLPIYVDGDVDVALRQEQIDVAFVALHGRLGEDGCVQGMLELLGIPYTGSDVMASALAMHKVKAKELFRLHNLPTPAYYALGANDVAELTAIHGDFGMPCVVKPVREGSSVGVTICTQQDQLLPAIERALSFDDEVLVERYISGKEVSVAILEDRAPASHGSEVPRLVPRALGAVEIAPREGFYDYANKYTRGATDYFVPPRLSPERYRGVLSQAVRAHLALGCRGATRVDMIVSDSGNEFVLEVNTVPGLTPTSLLPKIAEGSGISFGELCEIMLAGARLGSRRVLGERRVVQRSYVGDDRREPAASAH